jgi:ribosome-interacting GTPase 1
MPANLPPQYYEAEKVYRQAKSPEEKVEALEAMLAIMPKHKGTDKLRADLRSRISKFSDEAQRRSSVSRKGTAYNIRKEGAGQIVLVGLPNVGKSHLVSALTEASTIVAEYPFSTKTPVPGMMRFENIQIQLLDMPPITDRDAKPWFAHLLRNGDVLLLIVDLSEDPKMQLDLLFEELQRMKVEPIGERTEGEAPIGVARKKAVVVGNKVDLDLEGRNRERMLARLRDAHTVVSMSALKGTGLEGMKLAIFKALDIIRVYTKSPGSKPDFEDPIILKKGGTVEEAAESVHKDFRAGLKYAQIWGSGKFDGQRVKRDHVLEDGDVVEIHA